MIIDARNLIGLSCVDDVRLMRVGDLLSEDRLEGMAFGIEEFERRYLVNAAEETANDQGWRTRPTQDAHTVGRVHL